MTTPVKARWAVPLAAAVVVVLLAVVVLSGGHPAAGASDPFARFLFAVAVILLVSRLLGALARRLRQPSVVGEILGGVLLGPSVLGLLWPAGRDWLLPPDVQRPIGMAAQLGLVMFMFLPGCELRFTEVAGQGKAPGLVLAGALVVPFAAGAGLALAVGQLAGDRGGGVGYVLFIGLAISITAVPVLARILGDYHLAGTPQGNLALFSAVIGDGVAWAVLTVVLVTVGIGDAGQVVTSLAAAVALVLVMVFGVRRALAALDGWAARGHGRDAVLLSVLVSGAIGTAALTQLIGLHPVIGAFLFGMVVPRHGTAVSQMDSQLREFTSAVLLPLFFAGVGLQVSIGLLGGDVTHWLVFVAVLLVASAGKFAGACGAAKLAGLPTGQALQLGALMNCRGVTELIVVTIGWQAHLINTLGLTVLVLMALITTGVTGPLVRAFGRADVQA